jgi:pimeloyl-ACP methyl ester carboxylesterase
VLGNELVAGVLQVTGVRHDATAARRVRSLDGGLSDWIGTPTGFASAETYSRGEFIYEDHLWDAYGASSDVGAARGVGLDALTQVDPRLYRAEAAALYAPPGTAYGAGPIDYAADLTQVRVAASHNDIELLARTTVMTPDEQPAILVLVETKPHTASYPVPFNAGITTSRGDVALLLTGEKGVAVDLATGVRHEFKTAIDLNGYDNAIEGSIPRELIGNPTNSSHLHIALAAGRLDKATGELASRGAGPALANVAFRHEPARPLFDKLQAAALHDRTIDPFVADIDMAKLADGTTETTSPRPGYYERVMSTDAAISQERGSGGLLQHYGVYVPLGYHPSQPTPATFFLHGSGNDANDLPTIIPGLMRALGDERRSIVIAPKGRTSLSLWEGAGLLDVLEAWNDAGRKFELDPRRTTMAGYSMGGLGAYLLPSLFPDRFASTFVIEGPVGGDVWSPGVLFNGLPEVRRVFTNLRWVPTLIYQGAADNNVPITNGLAAVDALRGRDYRYRMYVFPGDNHFSAGVIDRWNEAVGYLDAAPSIDPNPPRVSYVRDIAVEADVDRAAFSDQLIFPPGGHQFHFDHAYWMRELTPSDPTSGIASVDARALAIPSRPTHTQTHRGAGASPDPYAWTGRSWVATGPPAPTQNGLSAEINGAAAVRFDALRMRLNLSRTIIVKVRNDHPLELRLSGDWHSVAPAATRNGRPWKVVANRDGLVLRLPPGSSSIEIGPAPRRPAP